MTYPIIGTKYRVPNRIVCSKLHTMYMRPAAVVFHYTPYVCRIRTGGTQSDEGPGASVEWTARETRGIRPGRMYSRERQGVGKMRVRRSCWPENESGDVVKKIKREKKK